MDLPAPQCARARFMSLSSRKTLLHSKPTPVQQANTHSGPPQSVQVMHCNLCFNICSRNIVFTVQTTRKPMSGNCACNHAWQSSTGEDNHIHMRIQTKTNLDVHSSTCGVMSAWINCSSWCAHCLRLPSTPTTVRSHVTTLTLYKCSTQPGWR